MRSAKEDDKEILILDDNELFEISVVPIPANPEALMRMRQRAAGQAKAVAPAPTPKGPRPVRRATAEETRVFITALRLNGNDAGLAQYYRGDAFRLESEDEIVIFENRTTGGEALAESINARAHGGPVLDDSADLASLIDLDIADEPPNFDGAA